MPPPSACFLGIDVARDGLSLVILSATGEVIATLERSYSTNPGPTTDPQDWWRAARTGIKEILRRSGKPANAIRCIGVTGDSTGVVCLAKDGRVLCPTVLGADVRTGAQVEQLVRTVGLRNLLNLASGPATESSPAVKLLWLRDNERRVWHDTAHLLQPKDFLRFRLTEALATDPSDAAATLLFSPRGRTWSKQLLTLLDINPAWLPAVAAGQAIAGRVSTDAARETGLQAGTPVITGASHIASVAVAVGALQPGAAMIELGGEGSFFMPTADAVRDPQGRLISTCHTVAGTWALAGSGFASGGAISWLTDQVLTAEVAQARRAKRDPLDLLAELAAEVPPGADGLLFLPPGLHTIAGFVGLSYAHRRGHLVRAVLESGALALRQALDSAAEIKRRPERITVTGAFAGNTLWCQILADALDHTIHALPCGNSSAIGAAMLASSAVGIHKGIEEACAKMVKTKGVHHPRKAATEAYSSLLPSLARFSPAAARTAAALEATA
ncbi:MAG: hypothetical protein H0W72_12675 [Planctomycetes bacterium]|nr:hypothetical protein [Planctomycetota bacterium]